MADLTAAYLSKLEELGLDKILGDLRERTVLALMLQQTGVPLEVAMSDGSTVERTVYNTTALAQLGTYTIGPISMDGYGAVKVFIFASRAGTFDIVEQETAGTSVGAITLVNDQATVASTWYKPSVATDIGLGFVNVAWTNGNVGTADVTIVVMRGSGASSSVLADPLPVTLELAAGSSIATTAEPLPVGLTNAAGTAIGETAADPLYTAIVDSADTELFTDGNPGSVQLRTAAGGVTGTSAAPLPIALTGAAQEKLGETTALHVEITDGAGTAVSQSASIDYATITTWEVAAQAVVQDATYTGTGRDCLYLKSICVTAHATQASAADLCLVQESNDNATWYTLAKCTLAASTNTILYAGPRSRRYVRISYKEGNTGAATINTSIAGSPL
jgi:hypothetical protein